MNESTKKFSEKLEKLLDELDREPELTEFLQEDLKRLGDAIKRKGQVVHADPSETILTTTAPPDIQVARRYPTFEEREFAMRYLSVRGIGFAFERAGDSPSLTFKFKWRDGVSRIADYDTLMAQFLRRYRELNPGAFIDVSAILGDV